MALFANESMTTLSFAVNDAIGRRRRVYCAKIKVFVHVGTELRFEVGELCNESGLLKAVSFE